MAADLGEDFEALAESLHAEVEVLRDLTEVSGLVAESNPTKDALERLGRSAEQARNLSIAMESRAVIEQAKGVIIGWRACTPDQAFSLLRRVSQDQNVKVRDLAVELVQLAVAGPGASPPPAHLAGLIRLE